jgi:hypothetical protein
MQMVKMIVLESRSGAMWRSRNFQYLIVGGKRSSAQKTPAIVGMEHLRALNRILVGTYISSG